MNSGISVDLVRYDQGMDENKVAGIRPEKPLQRFSSNTASPQIWKNRRLLIIGLLDWLRKTIYCTARFNPGAYLCRIIIQING